jgi:hypothetical protein
VVHCWGGGVDMRLGGVGVGGRGGGIRGINMMRSGRRGVEGEGRYRRME